MTTILNETHDPGLTSWVESANRPECDFPLQNLPFGVFSTEGGAPRVGVAIGAAILDVSAAVGRGLFQEPALEAAKACAQGSLNALMACAPPTVSALRLALSRMLRSGASQMEEARLCLVPMAEATLHLPAQIGNYSDFFTSIHHASNAGRMIRPDNPLLKNFHTLPVAYHGRASTIRVSGAVCQRPYGQSLPEGAQEAVYAPTAKLDFELEVGLFVGPGNEHGETIPMEQAEQHLFGLCLFNDWSARDVQRWEAQPLGPFLAKSFLSTVSPWVVTMEALAPFRTAAPARAADAPALLPYLDSAANRSAGAVAIALTAELLTPRMREQGLPAQVISRPDFSDQYWTLAQMLTHHAENGCLLQPGDLLGSGTVSGPTDAELGCLLELTRDGKQPLQLPNGEQRSYLEDGDEIILRGRCTRPGYAAIGFGACAGTVAPARKHTI